ncbi:coiled-coil domain-containing protein 149 [Pseudomyrmex gracilis]|uniref:coiled-coil domain-containing protein 149 n=1 Tax=Pseudomyrmex gracilis TaxID=219809 RepID=UPI000995801A|nr:coiled-coil domain-containing protein 149 [Pseudomyrmex gracilis]
MDGKSVDVKKNNSNDNDAEITIMLRRKLEMKSEALILLSEELEQCRIQRDQFKTMAEQLQERLLHLKKQMCDRKDANRSHNLNDDFRTSDLLAEAAEQNKCLRLQVEMLRQKLSDAEGDIKALRKNNNHISIEQQDAQLAPTMHQREEMIEQLEKLNLKCSQLQTDLQTVLDEKHELEMERDAFKCKAHRLNHELSKALSASKPVDLDALINENRYLQERLQQLLEEKELTRQSLSKYKSMLDSKRAKGAIKLGVNSAAGTVMTHKQVEQLLQESSYIPPQKSAAAVTDLRCLCTALLEALNDKTLALAHQKKANKILALRICELDSAVQSPTMKLLEGYTSANVDLKCDDEFNSLEQTSNDNTSNIEENNIITHKSSIQYNSSPESQVMQQLQSIQTSLPKNLGMLVQKALNNLKDNDKQKV